MHSPFGPTWERPQTPLCGVTPFGTLPPTFGFAQFFSPLRPVGASAQQRTSCFSVRSVTTRSTSLFCSYMGYGDRTQPCVAYAIQSYPCGPGPAPFRSSRHHEFRYLHHLGGGSIRTYLHHHHHIRPVARRNLRLRPGSTHTSLRTSMPRSCTCGTEESVRRSVRRSVRQSEPGSWHIAILLSHTCVLRRGCR